MKNLILIIVISLKLVAGAWYDYFVDLNKKFEAWHKGNIKKFDLAEWEIMEDQ